MPPPFIKGAFLPRTFKPPFQGNLRARVRPTLYVRRGRTQRSFSPLAFVCATNRGVQRCFKIISCLRRRGRDGARSLASFDLRSNDSSWSPGGDLAYFKIISCARHMQMRRKGPRAHNVRPYTHIVRKGGVPCNITVCFGILQFSNKAQKGVALIFGRCYNHARLEESHWPVKS